MSLLKSVYIVLLSSLMIACGGGGGGSGGGGGGSSPSVGVGSTNGDYSVSVDKSTVKLDIPWKGSSNAQVVHVKFKGDGVIAGFAPNEIVDGNIRIETLNTTATSADFGISYMPGVNFSDLVTLKRKLRFVSGKADGSKVVFVDIDVIIEQLDGFAVRGGAVFSGTWGTTPQPMSFLLDTAQKDWTVSSDFPGLTFEPKSGTGPGSVTIGYDFRNTPVNTTSAKITFLSSTGDKIEETVGFKLTSPELEPAIVLDDFVAPELGSSKQQITVPISFAMELSSLDVDWTASLPTWLSAEKTTGKTGQDQLILSLNPEYVPDSEGVHTGSIDITVNVPGQAVVQQIPIKLQYEKYRLQANRQAFAFADYATNEEHSGVIRLNSAIANEGAPVELDLAASASESWVVIDSVSSSEVRFHLNPADLTEGSHLADIKITSANPFIVGEKINIGYYKKDTAVSTTTPAALANGPYLWGTLADKLRPWIYIENNSNEISIFDVANQQKDVLFTADVDVKLGSMVISTDGQFLFFVGSNGLLYKMDLISKTLVNTFETSLPYTSGVYFSSELNFYRVNGKSFLGAEGIFHDADTGATLTVINGWWGQGGMALVPDAGVGRFEVDKGFFCGDARQVKLQFSYITNAVEFSNSTDFTEDFCNSSVVALSASMQQFAVNRRDRSTGFYVDVFGFESVTPGQYQVAKLAEHSVERSDMSGIAISSNGTLAVALRYDEESVINFYNADHTLSSTFTLPDNQINSTGWFLVTSDGKLLSYTNYDLVTQERSLHTKNM